MEDYPQNVRFAHFHLVPGAILCQHLLYPKNGPGVEVTVGNHDIQPLSVSVEESSVPHEERAGQYRNLWVQLFTPRFQWLSQSQTPNMTSMTSIGYTELDIPDIFTSATHG